MPEMNELDRAIVAMRRSQAALPDLCRELMKGELWFLVPYHPEIEGEWMELKNGSPLPFAMLEDAKGAVVPLFSSEERLDEGLKNGKVPANRYSAAAMPALQVLEILGKADLRATINKSCATGELTIPANLMRDLADGSALKPSGVGAEEQGTVQIVNAADYPTQLVQPAFEFMRQHRNFRLGWVFRFGLENAPDKFQWRIAVLVDPPDEKLVHDLNLIVQSVRLPEKVVVGLLDGSNTNYIQTLFSRATPFYLAADYVPPDGARAVI